MEMKSRGRERGNGTQQEKWKTAARNLEWTKEGNLTNRGSLRVLGEWWPSRALTPTLRFASLEHQQAARIHVTHYLPYLEVPVECTQRP